MYRKTSGAIERDPRKGICDHPDCDEKIPSGRRTFCSNECGRLFFYENNWVGLRYLTWFKDQGKCQDCETPTVFYDDGSYYAFYQFQFYTKTELTEFGMKVTSKYSEDNNYQLYVHQEHFIGYNEEKIEIWCYGECQDQNKVEIDHIQAIALGGASLDIDNLQSLCRDCHLQKTAIDRQKMAARDRIDKMRDDYFRGLNEADTTKQAGLEDYL